jgi:glycogen(starch) synthase
MPSHWEEAFGLVAVEVALMERPVVATRVGGLPEVVIHG